MSEITIYHSPNFLAYRGDHSHIVPPAEPAATVSVPDGLLPLEMLAAGYTKTQHLDTAWFNNADVTAHLRSTSTGDLIALPDGSFYVIEPMGFQPYQPEVSIFSHRLAQACRLLQTATSMRLGTAVDAGTDQRLSVTIAEAIATLEYALAAADDLENALPVHWEKASVGDLVGTEATGMFRVIARKVRPKWRAKRLLACIPDAQIWIDGPETWAVLVPVDEQKYRS